MPARTQILQHEDGGGSLLALADLFVINRPYTQCRNEAADGWYCKPDESSAAGMFANANAYLRLQPDRESLHRLSELSARIAADPGGWLLGHHHAAGEEQDVIGFRGHEDPHLTFVFFGEAARGNSGTACPAVLDEVHATLCRAAKEKRVAAEGLPMRVQTLELFPPGKQNLVVAKLAFQNRADELWVRRLFLATHEICARGGMQVRGVVDIPTRNACNNGGGHVCETLSDSDVLSLSESWEPHVTLGKIQATKQCLANVSLTRLNADMDGAVSVEIEGFLMHQPPPRARRLDWEQPLSWSPDTAEF